MWARYYIFYLTLCLLDLTRMRYWSRNVDCRLTFVFFGFIDRFKASVFFSHTDHMTRVTLVLICLSVCVYNIFHTLILPVTHGIQLPCLVCFLVFIFVLPFVLYSSGNKHRKDHLMRIIVLDFLTFRWAQSFRMLYTHWHAWCLYKPV